MLRRRSRWYTSSRHSRNRSATSTGAQRARRRPAPPIRRRHPGLPGLARRAAGAHRGAGRAVRAAAHPRQPALLCPSGSPAAVLLVWLAWLALRAGRGGLPGFVHVPPRAQHYIQMCCHLSVYAYWGYYWAAGLPVRAAAGRAALLRLRLRHAAVVDAAPALRPGLRPVPDRPEHQPLPLVQGRLVPVPVPAHRDRLPRQGVRALGARRASGCTSSTRRRSRWRCSRSC